MVVTFAILVFWSLSVLADLEMNKCYRFESVNYSGQYMRHRNYNLYKEPGSGDLYEEDSSFKVISAINGISGVVSLESLNFPGYEIRHYHYYGKISQCSSADSTCKDDGSWTVKQALAPGGNVSFASYNYKGFYLRHQGGKVRISNQEDSILYKEDASWIPHEVSCQDSVTS